MKKVSYTQVNLAELCVDCLKPLKKNLLNQNPKAKRCRICHKLAGKSTNFNRLEYLAKQKELKKRYQ